MFKLLVVFALVAFCAGQKSIDVGGGVDSVRIEAPAPVEFAQSGPAVAPVFDAAPVSQGFDLPAVAAVPLDVSAALPVEVAQPAFDAALPGTVDLGVGETIDIQAPNVDVVNPEVHLPKGAPEIVDIPHANIVMEGNKVEEKQVEINVPSPIIESPRPIIQEKPTIFRVPQPIIQVPKPIIQHHPVYYRVPHAVRYPNRYMQASPYVATGPSYVPHVYTGGRRYVSAGSSVSKGIAVGKGAGVGLGFNSGAVVSKPLAKHVSFSLSFPPVPSAGKTLVKHFSFGKK